MDKSLQLLTSKETNGKKRKVRLIDEAECNVLEKVLVRLIPMIGADQIIEKFVE